jgi:hypothetical protein
VPVRAADALVRLPPQNGTLGPRWQKGRSATRPVTIDRAHAFRGLLGWIASGALGLLLGWVVGRADPDRHFNADPLLRGVDELVRKQPASGFGARRVTAGGKHDRLADGIGHRADCGGGSGGVPVGVDAYLAEIISELRFHRAARRPVERLPG